MSLLTIINSASLRIGLDRPVPQAVLSRAQSGTLSELSEAVRATCVDLARRYPWQGLIRESVFTAVATEQQGVLSSFAPGFQYILNETMWNRTSGLPIIGSESPKRWQEYKGGAGVFRWISTSLWTAYRVRGEILHIAPAPKAGDQIAFEYVSRFWNKTEPTQEVFINDTDLSIFDEELVILGTIWRWKQSSGLEYSVDEYEALYANMSSRDGGKARMLMSQNFRSLRSFPLNVPARW